MPIGSAPPVRIEGPDPTAGADCERVLRTLPRWFGIEEALVEYVRDVERHPTFVAIDDGRVAGFLTVREHFAQAWEVHCLAVEADRRGRGLGRALHGHVERWLAGRGVRVLQVKTVAPGHPSPEYAETRAFYARLGYLPLETFPDLWRPGLPVLQLVKPLPP